LRAYENNALTTISGLDLRKNVSEGCRKKFIMRNFVISTHHKMLLCWSNLKGIFEAEHVASMGDKMDAYIIYLGERTTVPT
jgi:hypothetical protein